MYVYIYILYIYIYILYIQREICQLFPLSQTQEAKGEIEVV